MPAKYKYIFNPGFLTIASLLACAFHAAMLQTQYNQYVYTSAFKVILFILCPMIYFAASKDGKLKDLFSAKVDKKNLKLPLILALCAFAFIIVGFMALRPFVDKEMFTGVLAGSGINGDNFYLVFIYIVFINAALEELFFRGFVFMMLNKMGYRRYAYAYSCLLFAAYHVAILQNALAPGLFVLCIAGLAVAGLLFNYLTEKCKSVIGSLVVHVSANLALNLIGVFYLFG